MNRLNKDALRLVMETMVACTLGEDEDSECEQINLLRSVCKTWQRCIESFTPPMWRRILLRIPPKETLDPKLLRDWICLPGIDCHLQHPQRFPGYTDVTIREDDEWNVLNHIVHHTILRYYHCPRAHEGSMGVVSFFTHGIRVPDSTLLHGRTFLIYVETQSKRFSLPYRVGVCFAHFKELAALHEHKSQCLGEWVMDPGPASSSYLYHVGV